MAVPDYLNQVIDDLVIGDDYPVPRNYIMDEAIEIVKATLVIKLREGDADGTLISKSITAANQADGQIVDSGVVSSTCSLAFQLFGGPLPTGETVRLSETDTYFYGVKLYDVNGKRYTFEEGKIHPNPEAVKADS